MLDETVEILLELGMITWPQELAVTNPYLPEEYINAVNAMMNKHAKSLDNDNPKQGDE